MKIFSVDSTSRVSFISSGIEDAIYIWAKTFPSQYNYFGHDSSCNGSYYHERI